MRAMPEKQLATEPLGNSKIEAGEPAPSADNEEMARPRTRLPPSPHPPMILEFRVKQEKEYVLQHLSDARKIAAFHPLIYQVVPAAAGKYKVYESLKIGPIPYRFTYLATITRDGDRVTISAVVQRLTQIDMVFKVSVAGEATLVEETLSIRSFLPVRGFLQQLFRTQHATWFSNMENHPA